MKTLVRVGLSLTLLFSSICTAQEKPKGYDLAACGPDGYYGVHVNQVGKDLVLDQITEEPGIVKAAGPITYKFQSEAGGISDYTYQSGKNVLEIKLKAGAEYGRYYQDGHLVAVLFVGEDADGSKLAGFTVDHVPACEDLLTPETPSVVPPPSKDKKTT